MVSTHEFESCIRVQITRILYIAKFDEQIADTQFRTYSNILCNYIASTKYVGR